MILQTLSHRARNPSFEAKDSGCRETIQFLSTLSLHKQYDEESDVAGYASSHSSHATSDIQKFEKQFGARCSL